LESADFTDMGMNELWPLENHMGITILKGIKWNYTLFQRNKSHIVTTMYLFIPNETNK
jgi:hypothetical protein